MTNADEAFRLGSWQDKLADVECDTLITDAPYGARTHRGHNAAQSADGADRRAIRYDCLTPDQVYAFVDSWAPRVRQWIVSITCGDLAAHWRSAFDEAGLCSFASVSWVAPGGSVRLMGDGPASWTCQIMVARKRTGTDRNGRPVSKWGALPGAYVVKKQRDSHIGGKPMQLMRALVRDYSRAGDLICDPFAGYGSTLAAAASSGRRFVGSEIDPETHAAGLAYVKQKTAQRDLLQGFMGQQMTLGD